MSKKNERILPGALFLLVSRLLAVGGQLDPADDDVLGVRTVPNHDDLRVTDQVPLDHEHPPVQRGRQPIPPSDAGQSTGDLGEVHPAGSPDACTTLVGCVTIIGDRCRVPP